MGGTLAEPDRRAEVEEGMRWALAPHTDLYPSAAAATEVAMKHIEAAYQRGLMAGRSQAGYGTRRKPRKEKP